jgi:hypothetical protein
MFGSERKRMWPLHQISMSGLRPGGPRRNIQAGLQPFGTYSLYVQRGRTLATAFPSTQLFAHAIVKHNFRTLLLSYTTAYQLRRSYSVTEED